MSVSRNGKVQCQITTDYTSKVQKVILKEVIVQIRRKISVAYVLIFFMYVKIHVSICDSLLTRAFIVNIDGNKYSLISSHYAGQGLR